MLDAAHMSTANTTTNWQKLNEQVAAYCQQTNMLDRLWDASLMLNIPSPAA